MNRSAQLFRTPEAFEGRLPDNVLAPLRERPVRIGEQRTVLIRQEKARCDGIHTDV